MTIVPLTSVVACGGGSNPSNRVAKNDFSKLTALTGLKLNFNSTNDFSALDSQIVMAAEFSKPLVNYKIKYFVVGRGGIDIASTKQTVGKVWVEITADVADKNWQGTTPHLSVNVDAANFSNIVGTVGAITTMTTDSSNNTVYTAAKPAVDVGKVYKSNGTSAFVAIWMALMKLLSKWLQTIPMVKFMLLVAIQCMFQRMERQFLLKWQEYLRDYLVLMLQMMGQFM
ncbi:hypothetical protein [Spiroplasma endosymbiont of Nebria brevicollis]|uniref:hypothetical protein n=1 Tax=Spiroplasma endosymbiont of Nebria brevicollis TaxID=3066284 RepID=UPI00313DDAF4